MVKRGKNLQKLQKNKSQHSSSFIYFSQRSKLRKNSRNKSLIIDNLNPNPILKNSEENMNF